MPTPVDLQALSRRREEVRDVSVSPQRHVVSRYVLPGFLLSGFLGLLGWSARDYLLPRCAVRVVPVLVSLADMQTGGTPLFKAAGWVEPRPTPISVAALAPGVVRELLVVEDQLVTEGEPVANLIDDDARLALNQADATLHLREAEVQEAQATVDAAQTNLKIPAHLELPLAEADAALAVIQTELSNLPRQIERAEARLRLAEIDLHSKEKNKDAISGILIERRGVNSTRHRQRSQNSRSVSHCWNSSVWRWRAVGMRRRSDGNCSRTSTRRLAPQWRVSRRPTQSWKKPKSTSRWPSCD